MLCVAYSWWCVFPASRSLVATYPLVEAQSEEHHITKPCSSGKVWDWIGSAKFKWPSTVCLEMLIPQKLSINGNGVQGYWPWVHSDIFSVVPLTVPLLLSSPFLLFLLSTGMSVNSHPVTTVSTYKPSILALSCSFLTVPVPSEIEWCSETMWWTQTGRQEPQGPLLSR